MFKIGTLFLGEKFFSLYYTSSRISLRRRKTGPMFWFPAKPDLNSIQHVGSVRLHLIILANAYSTNSKYGNAMPRPKCLESYAVVRQFNMIVSPVLQRQTSRELMTFGCLLINICRVEPRRSQQILAFDIALLNHLELTFK